MADEWEKFLSRKLTGYDGICFITYRFFSVSGTPTPQKIFGQYDLIIVQTSPRCEGCRKRNFQGMDIIEFELRFYVIIEWCDKVFLNENLRKGGKERDIKQHRILSASVYYYRSLNRRVQFQYVFMSQFRANTSAICTDFFLRYVSRVLLWWNFEILLRCNFRRLRKLAFLGMI